MSRKNKNRRGELAVNGYSERWLRQGFPWVYPKEVVGGGSRPGAEVVVRGPSGDVLGRGLADQGFLAARVYRHDDGPLDREWLWAVLDRAATLRDQVVDPATSAYRLVHGENDGLPGVRVDWWDHTATVVLDSPGVAPLVPEIVAWLEDRRGPRSVYLCYRPDPRDERDFGGVDPAPGLVAGHDLRAPVRVTERGLAFLVRPDEGPDCGLYMDMREVRAWLEPHFGGRRVLNTFSYTGAFSVSAAYHGASEVVTTDLSGPALERAEANFVANDLDPAAYDFLEGDTFKVLDRLRRTGETFDLVILDPPSFSHGPAGTWSARKDWPRLLAASVRVLEPGGWLLVASNQGEVSPKAFQGMLLDGFKRAGRRAQEIWRGSQGPDFPAASWFPEGRYLKVACWSVE